MYEEFDEDFDEDELVEKHGFKTKEEKKRERDAKYQRIFKERHKVKKFAADFKQGEGIEEILARLHQDGVTTKEFVIKSFERYVKEGGFNGKQD